MVNLRNKSHSALHETSLENATFSLPAKEKNRYARLFLSQINSSKYVLTTRCVAPRPSRSPRVTKKQPSKSRVQLLRQSATSNRVRSKENKKEGINRRDVTHRFAYANTLQHTGNKIRSSRDHSRPEWLAEDVHRERGVQRRPAPPARTGHTCIEKSNGMTRHGRHDWLITVPTKFAYYIGSATPTEESSVDFFFSLFFSFFFLLSAT